jgi:hypothetical protein
LKAFFKDPARQIQGRFLAAFTADSKALFTPSAARRGTVTEAPRVAFKAYPLGQILAEFLTEVLARDGDLSSKQARSRPR